MGISGLTLFAEEAAGLRAPEVERRCPKSEKGD